MTARCLLARLSRLGCRETGTKFDRLIVKLAERAS